MIDSVDRIVSTPLRECPALFEYVLNDGPILQLAWLSVEPDGDDWFTVTFVANGATIKSRGDAETLWLRPEDKDDPVIQAELITGLASMGLEF
jgi:hypothetical protein